MSILEETLLTLANVRIFSVLDAKDGFHQVKLDEANSHSIPCLGNTDT